MTENEHIMDNGGSEQPPKGIPPEGKTPTAEELAALLSLGAPPQAAPEGDPSAESILAGMGMASPKSEGLLGTEPESATARSLDNMFRTLPEGTKSDFTESIDTISNKDSNEDDLVRALKKAPIPPGTEGEGFIRQMLEEKGHADKIDAVLARRTEWEKDPDVPEPEPEMEQKDKETLEKAKEDSREIMDEMKTDIARAREIENIPDEQLTQGHVDELKEIEEKQRGKIASWFDENPGKLHRANRLLVRPGIAAALLLMIMYMSALNVITSGAAKRVAK
ncbi:MAG TPA: hypothetical protein VM077_00030 [Candidatus Limnocylindrales bacterium]|nr:hypothetical protein [Candidatus Limnocylindrales bacterium]